MSRTEDLDLLGEEGALSTSTSVTPLWTEEQQERVERTGTGAEDRRNNIRNDLEIPAVTEKGIEEANRSREQSSQQRSGSGGDRVSRGNFRSGGQERGEEFELQDFTEKRANRNAQTTEPGKETPANRRGFLNRMATALLRSAPVGGTSSYGALPTIPGHDEYLSSSRGSSSDEHEGEESDNLRGEGSDQAAESSCIGREPSSASRQRRPSAGLGGGMRQTRFDETVETREGGIRIGDLPVVEGGEEDEDAVSEFDEDDPPDNSPYVFP